jgi:hypothetical protein
VRGIDLLCGRVLPLKLFGLVALILSQNAWAQVPCRPMSVPGSCGEDKVRFSISQGRIGDKAQEVIFILTYGVLTEVKMVGWNGRLAVSVEKLGGDRFEVMVGPDIKRSVRRRESLTFAPTTPKDLEAFGRSPISFRVET